MNWKKEHEQITEAGKLPVQTGMLSGMEENLSIQIEENLMLISPEGIKAYELNLDQMPYQPLGTQEH